MQALARANKVRLARAELKRAIGAGRRNVIDVIVESPWEAESMSLSELLCSQRRWGRARSRKLLSSAALSEGQEDRQPDRAPAPDPGARARSQAGEAELGGSPEGAGGQLTP